jgi:hypothetical protein
MKPRLKKVFKILGLIALTFVLLLAVLYVGWDISSRRTLAAAKERIRAAGLPVTVDDIRPPPVPDADNAAPVLAKLTPLLKPLVNSPDGTDLFMSLTEFDTAHPDYRLDAAGTRELTTLLDAAPVREVFALIDEAARKKGHDAKLSLERGPFSMFPRVSDWKPIVQLLGWRARLEASRSQSGEACRAVSEIIILAEFHADEPMLIAQLVRFQSWKQAAAELEKLASIGVVTPEWNRKLAEQLGRLDIVPGFVRALDGERIGMGDFMFNAMLERRKFQSIELDSLDQNTKGFFKVSFLYPKPLLRVEYAAYLDLFRQLSTTLTGKSNAPWDGWFSVWDAETHRLPKFGAVIRTIVPTLGAVANALRKEEMRVRGAEVGLALERYRAAKGGYPATQAELVPDFLPKMPEDVFTGEPIIYRSEPGGAIIYSVGPNGRDDGGTENLAEDKDDPSWFAGAAAARRIIVEE